jgi:hypothetical protein
MVSRISQSLHQEGLMATFAKVYGLGLDYWFDFRYGIDTCSWSELESLSIASENKAAGYRYQPARIMPLRKLLANIVRQLPANPVLVDFGSGKGRVLLVAAEWGIRELRGVEFSPELCRIARRNCDRFKAQSGIAATFQIMECDAVRYTVQPDENLFFFYNPFDESVLNKVLDNITGSLLSHPRKALIVYYNPVWNEVVTARRGLKVVRELRFWGSQFNLIENRD